jgi:Type VI secretion system/phage-baseplate injector OB domain
VDGETHRWYGKYRAKVTKTDDPKDLGRLRALVPEVLGTVESGWALPCAPYGGLDAGMLTVPPKDALVWVEFEAGDETRPIWSGCWRPVGKSLKGAKNAVAKPAEKVLRTEKGLVVSLDDDAETVTIGTADGKNVLRIKVSDGLVRLDAAKKIVLAAPAIELVSGSSDGTVLGQSLVDFLKQMAGTFNSHMHPGQAAPPPGGPVTPAPPASPMQQASTSLLSSKVKAS